MAEKELDQEKKHKKPSYGLNIKNPVVYGLTVLLLLIVIVMFVLVPVIGQGSTANRSTFGYYKGKAIEYSYGNYFFNRVANMRELYSQFGMGDDYARFFRDGFDATVMRTALLLDAERSGMFVSSRFLDEQLYTYPSFQENGEFSEIRYSQVPSSERMLIRAQIRDDQMHEAVYNDYMNIRTSSKAVDFFKAMGKQERKIRLAVFPMSLYPEAEVASFAKLNPQKFRRFTLSIITIGTNATELEGFKNQILTNAVTFEDLAKSQSRDAWADRSGDMGTIVAYDLESQLKNPADLEIIAGLAQGAISQVIETVGGPAIFRCNKPVAKADPASAESIAEVRKYLESFEKGKIEDYIQNMAATFSGQATSGTFTTLAARFKATVEETGFFPLNYANLSLFGKMSETSEALNGAAYRESFWTEIFKAKPNEISKPVLLLNHVVVYEVTGIRSVESNETLDAMATQLPSTTQSYDSSSFRDFVMDPSRLEDNFNAAIGALLTQ